MAESKNIPRLFNLKEERFLTKRIFLRMSENMHYEIFKFMNSIDLLQIRGTKLGGYQLISNNLLRSRITNYFAHLKPILSNHENVEVSNKEIGLVFEQLGKNKLDFGGLEIWKKWVENLIELIKLNPLIIELNLGMDCYVFIENNELSQRSMKKVTQHLFLTPILIKLNLSNL